MELALTVKIIAHSPCGLVPKHYRCLCAEIIWASHASMPGMLQGK